MPAARLPAAAQFASQSGSPLAAFGALRVLRVLRVLRLFKAISYLQQLRQVVGTRCCVAPPGRPSTLP